MSCDEQAGRAPQGLTAEQKELFRQCGERILERHRLGFKVDPQALADGRRWAKFKPLRQPLSSGEPEAR